MKAALVMFIGIMVIAAALGFICSAYISHNKKADNVPIDDGTYDTCVVTSSRLEKGKTVEVTYNGKKYVLCCVACKSVFEKNPDKFIQERKQRRRSPFNISAQRYPKVLYRPKL